MNEDAIRDARSDARYWTPQDEYSPAAVEPEWVAPEGHMGAQAVWSCDRYCPTCNHGLADTDTECWFCDRGCPSGCGPLDRDAFCDQCGLTSFPPAVQVEQRKAA